MCKGNERGEGLFTTQYVEADTIVAFYNGVRLQGDEGKEPSEHWEDDAYKILDQTDEENILDIPDLYRNVDQYQASLAHKTNHSFSPNAKFCPFYHPRFGNIPAIRTTKPLQAGNTKITQLMDDYFYLKCENCRFRNSCEL